MKLKSKEVIKRLNLNVKPLAHLKAECDVKLLARDAKKFSFDGADVVKNALTTYAERFLTEMDKLNAKRPSRNATQVLYYEELTQREKELGKVPKVTGVLRIANNRPDQVTGYYIDFKNCSKGDCLPRTITYNYAMGENGQCLEVCVNGFDFVRGDVFCGVAVPISLTGSRTSYVIDKNGVFFSYNRTATLAGFEEELPLEIANVEEYYQNIQDNKQVVGQCNIKISPSNGFSKFCLAKKLTDASVKVDRLKHLTVDDLFGKGVSEIDRVVDKELSRLSQEEKMQEMLESFEVNPDGE